MTIRNIIPNSAFLDGTSFTIDFELVTLGKHLYFVPNYAKHRPACQAILNSNYYEPQTHTLIELLLLHSPGNMLHAGTFYGDMLPSFSTKCPRIVYAFEPVLENYILAKLCLQKNNLKNVALFNSGLGENIGISHIKTHEQDALHLGGASYICEDGQPITVTTIDSFTIENLSVIHLDIEGFELAALKGAKSTIQMNKPTILIEDNKSDCGSYLRNLYYECVGDIPGLSVWSHIDHVTLTNQLLNKAKS